MTRFELERLAHEWIDLWHADSQKSVDALHAPEFIDHDSGGRSPDRSGFQTGIKNLLAAFPDFHARIEDLVIEEDRQYIAVRWSASGTHRQAYLGFPPTNRRIRFKGIEIIRVRNGRVVERWGEWDGLDLRAQLETPAP